MAKIRGALAPDTPLGTGLILLMYVQSQSQNSSIGGSRGRRWRPQGSRFFRFDIQIFQNVATLGVGTPPPMRSAPPLREILDPPLTSNTF